MKELLEQLNRVKWTSFDKYNTTAEGEKDGKSITLEVKFEMNGRVGYGKEVPVQAQLNILVDGVHAYRWDMVEIEEQRAFGNWFLRKESDMFLTEMRSKDDAREEAKEFFKSI